MSVSVSVPVCLCLMFQYVCASVTVCLTLSVSVSDVNTLMCIRATTTSNLEKLQLCCRSNTYAILLSALY